MRLLYFVYLIYGSFFMGVAFRNVWLGVAIACLGISVFALKWSSE